MQVFALPLGIITVAAVAVLWLYLTPVTNGTFVSPMQLLVVVAVTVPLHELIHAFVHPHFGRSPGSVLGLWPSRLLFYAHYNGEISRSRLIAILGAPLVAISGLPLLVCAVIGQAPVVLASVSVFNALCA